MKATYLASWCSGLRTPANDTVAEAMVAIVTTMQALILNDTLISFLSLVIAHLNKA